ncbi:hypothetical protein KKE68_06925 [Patescibacteria group bacterium]|nr:hypothetical protein [Patescibacteria group bacterium]
MKEGELKVPEKGITRRRFLETTGQAVVFAHQKLTLSNIGKAVLAADQGPRLLEVFDPESKVQFVPGQENRFPSESGVLALGGMTVENAGEIAKAITPGLGLLGPVMYADYADIGLDVPSIAKDILKVQKEKGVNTLSLYCHSMGSIVAAELVGCISDKIKIDTIFFDCSPVNYGDTRSGGVGDAFADISSIYRGSIITGIFNANVYGNPLVGGSPDLLGSQLVALDNGNKRISSLATIVERDNSDVIFLRPRDASKDDVVLDEKAEQSLLKHFPRMRVSLLEGKQGHANPIVNKDEYNRKIREAIFDGTIIASERYIDRQKIKSS